MEELRDLLQIIENHPAAKQLAAYFIEHIEKLKTRQLTLDPYTQPDEIRKIQIEIEVITVKLIQPFEFVLNHPDNNPVQKFSMSHWFKQFVRTQ